jgi:flavin-dependent dehydrogenase
MSDAARGAAEFDVLIAGGGPAGSSAAVHLSRAGLSVAIAERERFPRFKVGESLLPMCIPQFERLGVLERVLAHGFQDKFGVTFHDQESGLENAFFFKPGRPWPHHTLDVARAELDQILLDHAAAQPGVALLQPCSVEDIALDATGVTARLEGEARRGALRASFLVDASGRDALLAGRATRRVPVPGLGKVAVYAYYAGAKRYPGREEGNVRIFLFPDGWFWWIPLANDQTSVGCVMHARTARDRRSSVDELLGVMIDRCARVREGLAGARRVTPVYAAGNFSYRVTPAVGDRFACIGDAIAFLDPIFSAGVFLAMQSAEMAADEIVRAFREDRFEARRFAAYERRFHRGMEPFRRLIESFYDPSFLEVFLQPKPILGMVDAVTGVLAGGTFAGMPLRMRASLAAFFAVVRMNRWLRRRRGAEVESRLEW